MYDVRFHSDVVLGNEHRLLSHEQQLKMVEFLETSPESGKPLQGALKGWYRYRHSDVRAVYGIDRDSKTVIVIVIGQRRESEVYDEAAKRR